MNPSIIFSERGKQLLVLNKYKYGFQKCLKSGEKRWTCTKKTCKSFLLTLGEVDNNIVVTKHIQEHSHDAEIEKLHRQIANTSCKRKAIEDMSEKPENIIRRVLQENLPSTVTTVDVACIRRNLYNARRKEQPALPKSIEDCFRILEEITIETCKDSQYSLTYPFVTNIENQRRESLLDNDTPQLLVDSPIFRCNLSLTPIPTPRLLSPNFVYLETYENESNIIPHQEVDLKCFYRSENTALNLCNGVHGLLYSNDNEYFMIHPLPRRFHSNSSQPHVIIRKPVHNMNRNVKREKYDTLDNYIYSKRKRKKSSNEKLNTTLPEVHTKDYIFLNKKEIKSKRVRRETFPAGSPVFVETAVFVDRDLFDHMKTNFPADTENELIRFVLAMINAVELLYHDSSLGRPVNFLLKRLEVLKEEPVGLSRSPDIDRYLSNFCSWQRTKNPVGDREPQHWDHALILTGLDLYVRGKHGKISSQVVGLAPVAGMCTLTSSCTVNEGRHFESVYVVAHEIGHNLGMRHDGPMADNDCDPTSYIMSPTLGSGKITWSACSRRYLEKFLDTGQSRCLLDHGSSAGQLDHSAEGDLPGERFDANQQCMLKYGSGSRHSSQQPLDDVCRDLHCERERYTWTSHPALEGTSCGHNLWCRGGRCVTKGTSASASYRESQLSAARSESINGGWGKWKSYNDCASGCLYGEEGRLRTGSTGMTITTRLCNNPRPQGTGLKCEGHDKKYQTCNAKQCVNVPKLTIREFAEQICSRAKEVDKDLTGAGSQKISTDYEEACMVWCQTKNGGTKSRGWTFPDGTACQSKRNRYGKTSYCINGRCQEFHCDIYDEEQFVLQPELCPSSKEDNEIIWRSGSRRKDYGVQWVSASGCHFNCISPGSGLRLVVRKNKKGRSSIQLCHPDQYGCGRIKSPFQHASIICTKYRDKVRRLSGLGMQISPAVEDPDRPCRVACQDENIPHRFYLVNGEDGWFPFGTDCAKGSANKKAYCISGKCLEFGYDDTPMSQTEFTLPLLSRNKRSLHSNSTRITATLHQQELDEIISKLNATISGQNAMNGSNEFNIDLSNPIHVNMDMDMERMSPHNYYKSEQEDYYNYA